MAICPDHGGYTGDSCKKCVEKTKLVSMGSAPEIADADKYLLRSFEVEALNAQIAARDARDKAQEAAGALNRMAGVVFEKLALDPKEWILDIKGMKLIKREPSEDSVSNK